VNLLQGLGDVRAGEYSVTSAPLVVGDVVVTGAFVKDGQRLDAPSGAVRAFDARSGELRWVWDPVPPSWTAVTAEQVKGGATLTPGTPNVWASMSADPARGLIYVPTGNPAPDHFGGTAPRGDKSYYGSSLVALDAATGAVRWHFQTVHSDLWDYDVAAQPVLYQHRGSGGEIPALIGATKLGFIFLLNRTDGKPIFPVEERPVPQSTVPGEHASPTQPFPTKPAPLHPLTLTRDELWGLTFWDKQKCQEQFDGLDYQGVFTPPSLRGTLQYPGLGGGINWGSVSVDPVHNRMIVNLQSAPFLIKIVPREQAPKGGSASDLVGINPQEGTPYVAVRGVFISPWQTPCIPPPWGRLVAIDLNTGAKLWERPLGNLNTMAPLVGDWLEWGTPNSGGSLQTGGGLVFIAATMDKYFRAFDAQTGAELWRNELPFAGHAAPMTYRAKNGRQYVVIAAGGHGALGTTTGDALVAFALPAADGE
jgi:quinoprotein glucose dehydrogenase